MAGELKYMGTLVLCRPCLQSLYRQHWKSPVLMQCYLQCFTCFRGITENVWIKILHSAYAIIKWQLSCMKAYNIFYVHWTSTLNQIQITSVSYVECTMGYCTYKTVTVCRLHITTLMVVVFPLLIRFSFSNMCSHKWSGRGCSSNNTFIMNKNIFINTHYYYLTSRGLALCQVILQLGNICKSLCIHWLL